MVPNGSKATVASSIVSHQAGQYANPTKRHTSTLQVDDFHDDLERLVIGEASVADMRASSPGAEEAYQRVLMLIRHLGMELQRQSPADWNEFMSAACAGCQ